MIDEQYTDTLNTKALDIIDEGRDITAESLRLVSNDEGVLQACCDALELKAAVRLAASGVDVEQQLRAFHQRVAPASRSWRSFRWVAVAAVAAIFAGVFLFISKPNEQVGEEIFTAEADAGTVTIADSKGVKKPVKQNNAQSYTISMADYRKVMADEKNVERVLVDVPTGKTAHINLPDGSTAMLRPGSRLRFPTAFVGSQRLVMLEGEAYFKVEKDAAHPFVVQSDDVETTVLGTEFNISGSTVTLINGRVKVKENKSKQSVVMTPGQQASVVDSKFRVAVVDTLPYVYWRDGYIYYDNMTISDIMKSLGRTFNMSVRCMNTDVMQQRMRFMAERDKGVDAALELMNRMGKVRVSRKDNLILVE